MYVCMFPERWQYSSRCLNFCNFRFNIKSVSQQQTCVWDNTVTSFDRTGAKLNPQHPVEPRHSTSNGLLCLHSVNSVGLEVTPAKHVYENASFTHSILSHCSGCIFFHGPLFLENWGASAEHLNASWMVLDAFGRIIENQCIFGAAFISSQKYTGFIWPVEFNSSTSFIFQ